MTAADIRDALCWLQMALGAAIVVGALLLLAAGTNAHTPLRVRWPLIGLTTWGAWLALVPAARGHDSPPSLALAALVVYVLLRYGRQVRGILEGDAWWPPSANRTPVKEVARLPRRTVPAGRKWNPLWVLFGNEDDGIFGDSVWNPNRHTDPLTAVRWWFRNPCHNLCFYVVGVADKARVLRGPTAPDMDAPGLVWMVTLAGRRRLPFVAFNGRHVVAYIGWRPSGAFGLKLRRERSVQAVQS